jgi:putative peptidoglycan lipid II flippase
MSDEGQRPINPVIGSIVDQRGEPGGVSEPPDIDEQGWQESTSSQLVRSSAVVAVGTGLSRVTGLARTMAQVWVLGAFVVADSFNFANTVPNLLYDLLAGGVLAATLVPVFVDNVARRDRAATDAVVTVMTALLVAVTALAMLAVPLIVLLVPDDGQDRWLVAAFLWMFLPQIVFYGLTTLWSGVLNSHRRFAAAAFVPTVNNLVVIAVLVVFSRWIGGGRPEADALRANPAPLVLLGLGVTAGIVAQAVLLLPALRRAGIRLRRRFDWRHPAVRTVARLSGWTVGYVAVNQLTLWTILALAFNSDQGDVTIYNLAYQFFQLPYGLLAASVITAFMPDLAALAAAHDRIRFGERFLQALRITVFLVLPAAIGLIVLARPAVALLFERGAFTAGDVARTAPTLAAFAVGLVSFCLYLLAMRGFYAHQDTRTPFWINLGENAVNLILAVVLVRVRGVTGLALSFAMAYVLASLVAVAILHRRVGPLPWADSLSPLLRMAAAAAFMAAAVILVDTFVGSDEGTGALVRTAVGVAVGAAVYLGVATVLAVPELTEITARFAGRLPRRRRRPT